MSKAMSFLSYVKNKKYVNFVSITSLTGKCAQKFKNFCSYSLWTCLHHNGHINKPK